MTKHVQLGSLADLVMERKALDDSSVEHVESCLHCQSDVRWLRRLDALRQAEPPKSAVEAVLKTFKKRFEAA